MSSGASDADTDSVTTTSTLHESSVSTMTSVSLVAVLSQAAKSSGIDQSIGAVRLAAHTVSCTITVTITITQSSIAPPTEWMGALKNESYAYE